MGNLHTLYKNPQLRIVLVGDGNLARLIHPGRTRLKVLRSIEGPHCGLIPLNGPVIATTSGLKWNLGTGFSHSTANR